MSTSTRVLQRFVMPADGDADILQLYAEGEDTEMISPSEIGRAHV